MRRPHSASRLLLSSPKDTSNCSASFLLPKFTDFFRVETFQTWSRSSNCTYSKILVLKLNSHPFEKRCQEKRIIDATIFLMERTGDVEGALSELLSSLITGLEALKTSYKDVTFVDFEQQEESFLKTPEERSVLDILNVAIQLCERNAKAFGKGPKNEELWFKILDALMIPLTMGMSSNEVVEKEKRRGGFGPQRVASPSLRKLKNSITFFLRQILQNMMGYVELAHILDKIVKDHGRDQFGDFKSIIIAMLETFNYEDNILRTSKKLLGLHMHKLTNAMKQTREKAFCPRDTKCSICSTPFIPTSVIELFSCSHALHKNCYEQVKKKNRCPVCYGDIKEKKDIDEIDIDDEDQGEVAENDEQENDYTERLAELEEDEVPRYRILRLFERDVNIYDYTGARLNLAPAATQQRVKNKIKPRRPGTMDPKPRYSNQIQDEDAQYLFDFKSAKKMNKGTIIN